MKLSTITAIIALVFAATNVTANVFDNDYYEDNLRPNEINTNVDMPIHGDHFEGIVKQSDMKINVAISSDDDSVFDNDEYVNI